MEKDIFTKRWDPINGYTQEEAEVKKAKVDDAYGVNKPGAKWHPAEIVSDSDKKTGFKVIIRQIEE